MQIGLQRAQRLVTIATSLQLYSCTVLFIQKQWEVVQASH